MVVVLERVMRELIREFDLPLVIDTLPTQVSVRFNTQLLPLSPPSSKIYCAQIVSRSGSD